MSDQGNDRSPAEPAIDVAPEVRAALAGQIALFADDRSQLSGRELPLWARVAAQSPTGSTAGLVIATAWLIALALLVMALLRMSFHDAAVPLIWLNAFTLYIYLPAYAVLAFALWQRRWWLATISAAVVACHLAWVAPDFRPATPFVPPLSSQAVEPQLLRIYYANVHGKNREFDAVLAEAVRASPDVIVFVELQRPWFDELAKREPLKAYPYGTQLARRHAGDVCVFSRLPIRRQQMIQSQSRWCNVVDIAAGDESLRLFCLHSPRPLVDGQHKYESYWQEIAPILAEQPEPLVVIGDFNATQHSLLHEQLTSGRLRSAHEDRGRGYVTTWPNARKPIPPIRIDHVFLSPQVECVSIAEGEGGGSDHKSLILEIRVHADKSVKKSQ